MAKKIELDYDSIRTVKGKKGIRIDAIFSMQINTPLTIGEYAVTILSNDTSLIIDEHEYFTKKDKINDVIEHALRFPIKLGKKEFYHTRALNCRFFFKRLD